MAHKAGHYVRRLQQIENAVFMEETRSFGVTPAQVAVVMHLQNSPGIDQRTLAKAIGFDAVTVGGVIDRLEKRGLLQRHDSLADRRAKVLVLTADGLRLAHALSPMIAATQKRIMAPLSAAERAVFARTLRKLVEFHSA